ncbi:uncharacterized protein LOC144699983 [Wolffia australiana]
MLTGHAVTFRENNESKQHLLKDPVSESDDESDLSCEVLHWASFKELSRPHLQYETVIWVLISLLLVLAWGVGLIMLLYLPVRRYVLNRDICSRKLYVTQDELVNKVTRPSFIPFLGSTKIEKRIPLHAVIGIIIEQGCLQSIYGIHTFRVQSIAYGKAAAVDELQVQGVSDPDLLTKVIISGAAKSIKEKRWNVSRISRQGESPLTQMGHETTPGLRGSGLQTPHHFLLRKLEEVEQSVKRLESLVGGYEADIEQG